MYNEMVLYLSPPPTPHPTFQHMDNLIHLVKQQHLPPQKKNTSSNSKQKSYFHLLYQQYDFLIVSYDKNLTL